jgi:hypothetical protein
LREKYTFYRNLARKLAPLERRNVYIEIRNADKYIKIFTNYGSFGYINALDPFVLTLPDLNLGTIYGLFKSSNTTDTPDYYVFILELGGKLKFELYKPDKVIKNLQEAMNKPISEIQKDYNYTLPF